MSSIEHLLLVARTYAAAEGIDLSTASWRALGDTKKLPAIETGSDIQTRRFEKTMRWFSDNWPERTAWPEAVPRPVDAATSTSGVADVSTASTSDQPSAIEGAHS